MNIVTFLKTIRIQETNKRNRFFEPFSFLLLENFIQIFKSVMYGMAVVYEPARGQGSGSGVRGTMDLGPIILK